MYGIVGGVFWVAEGVEGVGEVGEFEMGMGRGIVPVSMGKGGGEGLYGDGDGLTAPLMPIQKR